VFKKPRFFSITTSYLYPPMRKTNTRTRVTFGTDLHVKLLYNAQQERWEHRRIHIIYQTDRLLQAETTSAVPLLCKSAFRHQGTCRKEPSGFYRV